MNRRDFLGSIACALAVAGLGSRIPKAAIVEGVTIGEPLVSIPLNWKFTKGMVFHFVASATNTAPATLNINGKGSRAVKANAPRRVNT